MSDVPTLDIIIVSYNVRDELDACLHSLTTRTNEYSARVTVVDNGSTDGTVAMLRARWPDVDVIAHDTNVGFAAANNVGIRHGSGELVLLLNPDTIVTPHAIATLVAALGTGGHVAAAGPRLVDGHGRAELSFGWDVNPTGELRQKWLMAAHARHVRSAVRRIDRWSRMPGPRKWLSAACLLVRRRELEAVGLLDERYFMYYEDVDLCVALRRRGRTVLFVPRAEVQHLRGRSASSNPDLARRRRESQMAYYRKHNPVWAPLLRWYLRSGLRQEA
ncbi:MAG: glycosyltransferase family 2 protein [Acidobacteria bacterium]|nr:glycosyltransferase family 2 protein [Acidobacteriota bacterium]